jgi:hypothetical protein
MYSNSIVMNDRNKSCEECCCVDSESNPILEEWDKQGFLVKSICMMCYAENLDENKNTND